MDYRASYRGFSFRKCTICRPVGARGRRPMGEMGAICLVRAVIFYYNRSYVVFSNLVSL